MYRRNAPLKTLIAVAGLLVLASSASAIKVCTYNLANFPNDYTARLDDFRIVMNEIDADVIVVQEIDTWQSANAFRDQILNYYVADEYERMPFINGPNTDNACFYKADVLDSLDYGYLDTGVRYTTWYKFRPMGYTSDDAAFVLFSTHLKAGSTGSDESERLAMTTVIRSYCNDYPAASNFMVAGDFNVYTSSEGAYQMLIGFQTDNDGRLKDPINTGGSWHDNYSLRSTFTQSPRVDGGSGTGGGMDDRFDFVLVSYALDSGDGLDYIDGSYTAYGNDGLRFNNDINDPPNAIVSSTIADALYGASDHIPVFLELQVPAKVDAPALVDFGDYMRSTVAEEILTVGNMAWDPGEDLDYSMSVGASFTVPGGSFVLGPGESNDHTVAMDTGSPGDRYETITIASNDVDDPSRYVNVQGRVFDDASPSFEWLSILLSTSLDFGSHEIGAFSEDTLLVYNETFFSHQAELEVYDAEITGGDGRFSIVGGFTPMTLGWDPGEYVIAFDSTGAAEDSTYTATLIFSTRDDQTITGASERDALVCYLSAHVTDGTAVPDDAVDRLALSAGSPNPFTERTTLRFALPVASDALVEVYDVTGRLVATLADGTMPAGENRLVWDGTDARGTTAATGIYFCRAQVGEWTESRKLVLIR